MVVVYDPTLIAVAILVGVPGALRGVTVTFAGAGPLRNYLPERWLAAPDFFSFLLAQA